MGKGRMIFIVLTVISGLLLFSFVQEGVAADKKLIIAGRDGNYGNALQLAVDAYIEQHPDVEIELLKLPYSGLLEKVVIDLKEATGAYDLLMMDDTWATGFALSKVVDGSQSRCIKPKDWT